MFGRPKLKKIIFTIFTLFSLFLLRIAFESFSFLVFVNDYVFVFFRAYTWVVGIIIPQEINKSDVRRGRGCRLSDSPEQTGEGGLKISILAGRPSNC